MSHKVSAGRRDVGGVDQTSGSDDPELHVSGVGKLVTSADTSGESGCGVTATRRTTRSADKFRATWMQPVAIPPTEHTFGTMRWPGAALTAPAVVTPDRTGGNVTDTTCSVPGCDRQFYARGWCNSHYKRWQRTGDVGTEIRKRGPKRPARLKLTPEQRFDRYTRKTDLCWEWLGNVATTGYGRFGLDYKVHLAHRWSYERHVGPIPEGLHIDHLCRNRACVNPDHMEPVTLVENTRRGRGLPARNTIIGGVRT